MENTKPTFHRAENTARLARGRGQRTPHRADRLAVEVARERRVRFVYGLTPADRVRRPA